MFCESQYTTPHHTVSVIAVGKSRAIAANLIDLTDSKLKEPTRVSYMK